MNTITLDSENITRFQNFSSIYDIESYLTSDLTSNYFIKSTYNKKCRFCKKEQPKTTFKKKAHVIPQLLGNKFLLSRFECDKCNSLFGKYEDSLAAFTGVFRTFAKISGQKGRGIPKFKNPHTGLEIFEENANLILNAYQTNLDNEINVDEKKKTIQINTEKQSYIPLNVFRAILKIGLCSIQDKDVEGYSKAFSFLQEDINKFNKVSFPFLRMIAYFVPGVFSPNPTVFIFRKKPDLANRNCFTHSLALYFSNHVYQIFLPFFIDDKWLYKKGSKINFPILPLFVDQSYFKKYGNYSCANIDISSTSKTVREPVSITLTFDSIEEVFAN